MTAPPPALEAGRPGDARWLVEAFEDGDRRRLCMRYGCTTCGCGRFLDLVAQAVAGATRRSRTAPIRRPVDFLPALHADGLLPPLLTALSALTTEDARGHAAPLILLSELLVQEGGQGLDLTSFSGRPFQAVVDKTRAVRRRRVSRGKERRILEELQQAVRALRRIRRAQTHEARLAAKAQKDADWRANALAEGRRLESQDEVAARRAARKARRDAHRLQRPEG